MFYNNSMDFPYPSQDQILDFCKNKKILPWQAEKNFYLFSLVEALQQEGWFFILKGGFSLSMVYGITKRFSRDVDIQIEPPDVYLEPVRWGRGHNHKNDIKRRKRFFQYIADHLILPGFQMEYKGCIDPKARNAGYEIHYSSLFSDTPFAGNIVLEAGFARTDPFHIADYSSWLVPENKIQVSCYDLEYNLVEKINVVAHKYDMLVRNKYWPGNFLHHYYDILKLLQIREFKDFLQSSAAKKYIAELFKNRYSQELLKNPAFIGWTPSQLEKAGILWEQDAGLYYEEQPSFHSVLIQIQELLKE